MNKASLVTFARTLLGVHDGHYASAIVTRLSRRFGGLDAVDESMVRAVCVRMSDLQQPLSVACGYAYFRELELECEGTLTPRADSEVLVEVALKFIRAGDVVVDLGTGSGALLLSTLQEADCSGVGVDVCPVAIEIATKNALRNGLAERARFRCLDWNSHDCELAIV
jgi:release factor glutamine methyltransferase